MATYVIDELCFSNLRRCHTWFSCFLSNDVLCPSKDRFSKRKFPVMNYDVHRAMNKEYVDTLCYEIKEDPIHQCNLDELHFYRFICRLCELSVINVNIVSNNSRIDVSNCKKYDSEIKYKIKKSSLGIVIGDVNLGNKYLSDCKKLNSNFDKHKRAFWDKREAGEMLYITNVTAQQLDNSLAKRGRINDYFPLKTATAAHSKTNLYLDDALSSLKSYDNPYYIRIINELPYLIGLSNDQAVCLIYNHLLVSKHGFLLGLKEYCYLVYNKELAKSLSDLTKLFGVANNPFSTFFTELDALYGRGTKEFDVDAELRELSGSNIPKGHNINFEKGLIYKESYKVLEEAMPHLKNIDKSVIWQLVGEDIDHYWRNRNLNCVNGAHHLPTNCKLQDISPDLPKTRMVWLENTKDNPLFTTEPIIDATLSLKYENPKIRPIKSEDTIAYLHEDYLHRAIEREWRHPSILLDPALSLKAIEAQRVSTMLGNEYVMLDFSVMDKQHALNTLLELTEAKCDFLGLPKHMREWYVEAEKNQWLRSGDVRIKLAYSLLTGRRSTTFINSVLNNVYVKLALGTDYSLLQSGYFVGDDIILRMRTRSEARIVINKALNSKSVFHPRKQSWGYSGEFLRHSVKGISSYGYVNRSIASFVCGSWVSELKLEGSDVFSLFYRYAWTIDNRAMQQDTSSKIMTVSLHRRTGLNKLDCKHICSHRMPVHGGPTTSDDLVLNVLKPKTSVILDDMNQASEGYASQDYINEQVHNLKLVATPALLGNLQRIFKTASYKKGLTIGYKSEGWHFDRSILDPRVLQIDYKWVNKVVKGLITKHPTLPSLRGMLHQNDYLDIAYILTGERYSGGLDFNKWLLGPDPGTISTTLNNNFDDLCQMAKEPFFKNTRKSARICLPRICHY